MLSQNTLWVEKYRPKTLSDLVLIDEHRAVLEGFIEKGVIPHLLLVGVVGSGKTTIAKILLNSLDCSSLELNASDERGIDTVRDRVMTFLRTMGLKRWRVVFLDEADALTTPAQFSLRNVMERFSEKGRFILTANYEEKILEPIRSRCQTLRFNSLDRKEVFKRVSYILLAEGVKSNVEVVLKVIDDHYPDVRKIINTLQLGVVDGEILYRAKVDVAKEVREALKKKDIRAIRKIVMTHRPDYIQVYRSLFDTLPDLTTGAKASLGITIAEYLYRDAIICDREVNFAACCLEMMKEL